MLSHTIPYVMELVEGKGLMLVQCGPTQSEGQSEVQKTSSQKITCLHAGRSYYSSGLSCALTTGETPGGMWGDRWLMVLLELLSRQLSHRMPNLSWQWCTLTRYNVQGLTAHGIWLWLARLTVLWVGD
jgi:hypothetical protein